MRREEAGARSEGSCQGCALPASKPEAGPRNGPNTSPRAARRVVRGRPADNLRPHARYGDTDSCHHSHGSRCPRDEKAPERRVEEAVEGRPLGRGRRAQGWNLARGVLWVMRSVRSTESKNVFGIRPPTPEKGA